MGTRQDITERKRTETALRLSETRLARAQRVAHVGSWEFDIASGGITCRREMFHLLAFDPTH